MVQKTVARIGALITAQQGLVAFFGGGEGSIWDQPVIAWAAIRWDWVEDGTGEIEDSEWVVEAMIEGESPGQLIPASDETFDLLGIGLITDHKQYEDEAKERKRRRNEQQQKALEARADA
jgi:hypothetical protein